MSFDLKIANNDLILNADGDINIVTNNDKLRQDILKILITNIGTNRFHPWYGSAITKKSIGQVADQKFNELQMTSSVQQSIENLMKLQKRQQQSGQVVSAAELIIAINNVFVERDKIEPRQYNIVVSILTGALTTINQTFTLRL